MQKSLARKGVVIGIIILFVGAGVIPSINGDNITTTTSRTIINEGSLSGYVNDTIMNPIEGALVRVYFHETYEEDYSDSSGYYHVTNIPICYCLKNATASKEGYETEWILLSIDENTTYDFVLTPSAGNTLYVGGSEPGNYSSIQDAINDASDGDTVFVFDDSSPYYENVLVDKSIDLTGENKQTTIVDGGGNGRVVDITVEEVSVSGFTIRNSYYGSGPGNAGLLVAADDCSIYNNIIVDNGYGIGLHDTENSIIYRNEVTQNKRAGIAYEDNCNYNEIYENNITNNDDYGIYLKEDGDYNDIHHNIISGNNNDGIKIEGGSSYNTVTNNVIQANYVAGVAILSNSNHNHIFHNKFLSNKKPYDSCDNYWDDNYPSGGNYWDDYEGEDADGDGFGDTPYYIPGGNNKDRFPFMFNDERPPQVAITNPEKAIYLFGIYWKPFTIPIIIGGIDIEAEVFDDGSGIKQVEFYIDGELKETDIAEPFRYNWGDIAFFSHTITVTAYDNAGNHEKDELLVWKFL